ncbi:hypothetical protein CLV28_1036 [Sediminihabitans luteus]|uniref:VOC domain-containing protein n=1 Tax=Sediminihabitans luteus TaxID=1138585 RepID=A0A2M9D0X3_9CELL|nr:VOC family protein [Sediminihabitans luteus]PJJ77810.1 hypothetical protein CLV28_1036 [Sediminihabitans luteus]GII99832.1 putative glyoxalase/bleomycin resistance protein [Sediminihabitans luteus]
MAARANVPLGAPCWNDLGTDDLPASVAFYTAVLGWEHHDYGAEFGHYGAFTLDGKVVAGVGPNPGTAPSAWQVYLKVSDAAATLDRAVASGGTALVPVMEIPGQGVMAFVADPGGAAVGLWEARGHDGFQVAEEPGAPTWHELLTRDYRAALDFYQDVFGWQIEVQGDTNDFRYAVQTADDAQWAGVMDASAWLPEAMPAHWGVYVEVTDADETAALATAHGGSVEQGPEDTPYGRLATLVDPFGARFKVMARPEPA